MYIKRARLITRITLLGNIPSYLFDFIVLSMCILFRCNRAELLLGTKKKYTGSTLYDRDNVHIIGLIAPSMCTLPRSCRTEPVLKC